MKHNSKLTAYSQALRREMTKEERHLWYDFLKPLPITINRQKAIGNYIVDFYCGSKKLAIEIDGSQHYEDAGEKYDTKRSEYLNSVGISVIRFSNADINRRFADVCEEILQYVGLGDE